MEIENKYKLFNNLLELQVLELLDFNDYPILNLEYDILKNLYLSYLIKIENEVETRVITQVSKDRLSEIYLGNFSIKEAFEYSETNLIYLCDFNYNDGEAINTYLIPKVEFNKYFQIPDTYYFIKESLVIPAILDTNELLDYATRKHKMIIDLYIQAPSLNSEIKPFAIYKILVPFVEIIKSYLEFDQGKADDKSN
jgi:hypothetical protein